jgi:hypothetical protein
MAQIIQLRRGATSEWESTNPVLAQGELGVDLTLGRFKIGNGVNTWNTTSYSAVFDVIIQSQTGDLVFPTFASAAGVSSIGISTEGIVFSPSSGNLGIGTTNPSSRLTISGDANITGIITATDFNSASDIKLKDNVKTIEDPISKIIKIDGVSFDWKDTKRSSMGVIAQNIETVLPELVTDGDTKTVNYNGITGLLIECIKSQQEQINALNKRLDELTK